MALVEPIPGEPAALATVGDDRALVIADYHAGYEAALRYERGVQVPSQAGARRKHLCALVDRTAPDRLVIAGDLMHSIGDPGGAERGELEVLLESLPPIEVTLVKGNHDGAIESWLGDSESDDGGAPAAEGSAGGRSASDARGPESTDAGDFDTTDVDAEISIHPGRGVRLGDVGVCHGHGWPAPDVLEADVLCIGHEHPCVRLEDEVGGSRVEPVWLRGELDPDPFRPRPEYEDVAWLSPGTDAGPPSLVVLPAFNELVGGTWVNVPDQSFLTPFLPAGLASADAYLLDGTRLGEFAAV